MDDALFSYASAEDPALQRAFIRLVEHATGQPRLKRLYFEHQRNPRAGETFWAAAIRLLELDIRFDAVALAGIPREGPLLVVANHPYGVLDGLAVGWLTAQARRDFVILTNAVLLRAPEIRDFVLPVDFSETSAARETNLASRAAARTHLQRGGAVVIFPAGAVSTSSDFCGRSPAIDAPWTSFVAQLAQRTRATIVPIWFAGQNSRCFQIASHISVTLRLAPLFHEVNRRSGSALRVEIGDPIAFDSLSAFPDRRSLTEHLRAVTYALARGRPSTPSV